MPTHNNLAVARPEAAPFRSSGDSLLSPRLTASHRKGCHSEPHRLRRYVTYFTKFGGKLSGDHNSNSLKLSAPVRILVDVSAVREQLKSGVAPVNDRQAFEQLGSDITIVGPPRLHPLEGFIANAGQENRLLGGLTGTEQKFEE